MVFSSMIFLWLFLPVTLILYWTAGKIGKQKSQNLLLLLMSLLFYSFGEPRYILLLLASAILNYGGGLAVEGFQGRNKKLALAVTVAGNLLILGYFKYYDFLAETVNLAAKGPWLPVKHLVLPIGISFYTFQALSYVIDLYRGNCKVQKSFYKLLLYITFFPQLIAGPIVRYRDIAGQIEKRKVNFDGFSLGVSRFIIGLGKKVILANTFAASVDQVFALPAEGLATLVAWYGILLYGMQIYFDFSGYSDMAIGLGKMFGFDFMENFCMPYCSRSIREFWRRWHISLSTWFREYLYIPLGGNRRGNVRTYVNLFLVFLATGLWHGAGWNFVLWGMLHGFFLVMERAFLGKYLDSPKMKVWNHLYCLFVVMTAWVFFRAETLTGAWQYLMAMFGKRGISQYGFVELFGRKCIALSAVGVLLCGVLPERIQSRVKELPLFRAAVLPAVLFLTMILLAADSYNPFIYFRF